MGAGLGSGLGVLFQLQPPRWATGAKPRHRLARELPVGTAPSHRCEAPSLPCTNQPGGLNPATPAARFPTAAVQSVPSPDPGLHQPCGKDPSSTSTFVAWPRCGCSPCPGCRPHALLPRLLPRCTAIYQNGHCFCNVATEFPSRGIR